MHVYDTDNHNFNLDSDLEMHISGPPGLSENTQKCPKSKMRI